MHVWGSSRGEARAAGAYKDQQPRCLSIVAALNAEHLSSTYAGRAELYIYVVNTVDSVAMVS